MLFDRGHVSTPEPFQKLVNQGMILGENGEKMSKARGNVVNPDDVVRDYGADSLRLFEMFMGPLEAVKPWSTAGVVGVRGFLDRVWRLIVDDKAEELKLNEAVQNVAPTDEQIRMLHKTIKQVTERHPADGVQHGHRPDDGVHQLLHQAVGPPARSAWRSSC